MKTSINELLKNFQVSLEDTVYVANSREMNAFPVTAGDFFCVESALDWQGNLWIEGEYQRQMQEKEGDAAWQTLKEEEEKFRKELRSLKELDKGKHQHTAQIRAFHRVLKGLEEAKGSLSAAYREEVEKELASRYGTGAMNLLSYKNTVCVGSFSDLERKIPALSGVELDWLRRMPLFLNQIDRIQEAQERQIPIGLVGGPCLFGSYEMEIRVQKKDGSCLAFDYNTGRGYDRRDGNGLDFSEYIEQQKEEISGIGFRNWKKGVTAQEYDSLEALFAFGKALDAKVAIPIPDMSYRKFLSNTIDHLAEGIQERALADFGAETRKIADMYLRAIEYLKGRYPQVEVKVLHERDQALCQEFYEKREHYFCRSSLIQRLTAKKKKTDAVLDYISMLALPFYFYGTPQVIQIDSLDEVDSYRKCRKVHKDAFTLSAALYPERLSRNGTETIFNAPLEYKEYLGEEFAG